MKVVDETLLDRAHDHAFRFLSGLADRRVGVTATRDGLLAALRVPLTAPGEPASDVIDALATDAGPSIMAVAGAEAHVTIYGALRYLGFGTRGVQRVEADEQGRMRPEKLKELMHHLSGPTIICAQAGNVNSGAVDPMPEIAGIAHKHDAWLH